MNNDRVHIAIWSCLLLGFVLLAWFARTEKRSSVRVHQQVVKRDTTVNAAHPARIDPFFHLMDGLMNPLDGRSGYQ